MFWNFMNVVHGLPTFDNRDVDPWWTDEEEKVKNFLYGQLSYVSMDGIVRLVDEMKIDKNNPDYYIWSCIRPSMQIQDGKIVYGLDKEWSDFISRHVDIGTYIGSVTHNLDQPCFICYECGSKYNEDEQESMCNSNKDTWMFDSKGFGRRFNGTVDQIIENKHYCPECNTECETAWFEEEDIDTIWIFEKGSFVFCHYGRGAGISFRFHSSINMEGLVPMTYFSTIIDKL